MAWAGMVFDTRNVTHIKYAIRLPGESVPSTTTATASSGGPGLLGGGVTVSGCVRRCLCVCVIYTLYDFPTALTPLVGIGFLFLFLFLFSSSVKLGATPTGRHLQPLPFLGLSKPAEGRR